MESLVGNFFHLMRYSEIDWYRISRVLVFVTASGSNMIFSGLKIGGFSTEKYDNKYDAFWKPSWWNKKLNSGVTKVRDLHPAPPYAHLNKGCTNGVPMENVWIHSPIMMLEDVVAPRDNP